MKHLESPMRVGGHAGNNMVPKPHDKEPFGGHAGGGKHLSAGNEQAPGCGGMRPRMPSKTPDQMGTWFGHKPNKHGV